MHFYNFMPKRSLMKLIKNVQNVTSLVAKKNKQPR